MDIIPEIHCPSCNAVVLESANFCLQCGAKLKEPPFSISIAKQILVYFVSFFLAPFGLGYAFKYLKISDARAKRVGIIAIILTIIAVVVVFWISISFTNSLYGQLNAIGI